MIDSLFFVLSLVYNLLYFWLNVGLLLAAFLLSVILQLTLGRRKSFCSDFRQVLKHVQTEANELGKNAYSSWPADKAQSPESSLKQPCSETSVEVNSTAPKSPKVNFVSRSSQACNCPFKCSCKLPCKCPTNVKPAEKVHSKSSLVSDRDKMMQSKIEIFTSGLCNEEKTASSVGVYFGPRHGLNFGASLPGHQQHSVMRAELEAAHWALQLLHGWKYYVDQPIIIRTTNLNMILSMKRTGCAGHLNHEAKKLRRLAGSFPSGVTFEYVESKCKKHGNEKAFKLALAELRTTATDRTEKSSQCSSAEGNQSSKQGSAKGSPQRAYINPALFY